MRALIADSLHLHACCVRDDCKKAVGAMTVDMIAASASCSLICGGHRHSSTSYLFVAHSHVRVEWAQCANRYGDNGDTPHWSINWALTAGIRSSELVAIIPCDCQTQMLSGAG